MTVFFAAIADDFTGATDLAAMIARSGTPVSLRLGVPETAPMDTIGVEVIALKCRSVPAAQAIAQTSAARAWLQAAGAQRVFWKYCSTFDSTPQGNIGPVAEALMQALGTQQTIHVPAFPENGRSVYMGNLFVGEQPLAESPMKDHPLNPMRDSNLLRLLAPQTNGTARLIAWPTVAQGPQAIRAALPQAEGLTHNVVDAVSGADIQAIAQATAHVPLTCGGSALGGALAEVFVQQGALRKALSGEMAVPTGDQLVLSGSCSAMTRAQVAGFAQHAPSHRLDPLSLAAGPQALAEAQAWLSAQTPGPKMIYASANPAEVAAAQAQLGVERAGQVVEQALATLAQTAKAAQIVVAGGETSGAVVKALGISRLTLGPEIAPGVPWCFAQTTNGPIALALKSGNFGDAAFFQAAFARLNT